MIPVISPVNSSPLSSRQQKRLACSADLDSASTPKRSRFTDTPVRQLVSRLHPSNNSPAIAVS